MATKWSTGLTPNYSSFVSSPSAAVGPWPVWRNVSSANHRSPVHELSSIEVMVLLLQVMVLLLADILLLPVPFTRVVLQDHSWAQVQACLLHRWP